MPVLLPYLLERVTSSLLSAQVDLQPYLDIVTDELEWLYYEGVNVSDGAGNETALKAMLLSIVSDYRGLPKLFRLAQSPALRGACYVCKQKGVKLGSSTVQPGPVEDDCMSATTVVTVTSPTGESSSLIPTGLHTDCLVRECSRCPINDQAAHSCIIEVGGHEELAGANPRGPTHVRGGGVAGRGGRPGRARAASRGRGQGRGRGRMGRGGKVVYAGESLK